MRKIRLRDVLDATLIFIFVLLLGYYMFGPKKSEEAFKVEQDKTSDSEASITISNGKEVTAYDVEVKGDKVYVNVLTD